VLQSKSGPGQVKTDTSEGTGAASTDAGDVSWVVPMGSFTTATFVPGVAAHTWQAAACAGSTIGRKGMVVAARTLALAGVELLEKPAEVEAAKAAYQKRLAGRHWVTRIPADGKPPLDYAVK
jgi:aminobenzoyl-glutamate utilization protein B